MLLVLLLIGAMQARAQACEDELAQADELYAQGQFDQAIRLLDRCLDKPEAAEAERQQAYQLKGLALVGKGLESDARETVRRLLELVPNYEPDPAEAPPQFVEMVEEVKRERAQEEAPAQEEAAPVSEERPLPPAVQPQPPAQTPRPGFTLFAGASLPLGDFADDEPGIGPAGFAKTGLSAMADFSLPLGTSGLRFVASAAYLRNGVDEVLEGLVASGLEGSFLDEFGLTVDISADADSWVNIPVLAGLRFDVPVS